MGLSSAKAQPTSGQSLFDAGPLRPGHVWTDIGLLPVDWSLHRLGEAGLVCRVGSGRTPTGGTKVYKPSGRAFVRSQNVGWGRLLLDDLAYIDEETHSSFEASEILEGDVLLNITGASIGRCAVATSEVAGGNVNQHVCEIRVAQRRLNPTYLCAFILSHSGQRQIDSFQAGGNRQGLNFNQVRSFLVPVPPLQEQRAIAEALSDVDGLLAAQDALIAKKRDMKRAAMQQLLTGRTRLPGFGGPWETKLLGDVAEVKTGPFGSALHQSDYVANGTPIITVEHLGERGVIHKNLPRVSDADRVRLLTYSLNRGDIVFSRVGSVDRNALIASAEEGWLFSGRLLRVRPDAARVSSPYLSHHFHGERFRSLVREVSVGQTMASLNTQILKRVEVVLPSLAEQIAIATVLTDLDVEIAALESRRDKTRMIKQGMMQQLLTGRVRLVQPEATA